MRAATSSTATGKFRQDVRIGPHALVGDEGADKGGTDAGPSPTNSSSPPSPRARR